MATFAELGRQQAIAQLFEGTGFQPFGEPLYFEAAPGECVTTATATLLEGVDFDLVYFPLKHLGYKAVIAATGELYAVMAHPRTLSITLGVSAKLDYEQVRELWSGVVSAAKEHGYKSLSLMLQPSRNGLSVGVAATGACSKLTCVRRSKAHTKDLICVTGSLGAAYLGMQLLEREKVRFDNGATTPQDMERYKMLVGAYLKPELGAGVVSQFEDIQVIPSYGYFITRGLSDALLRLTRDSGLGAKVYADKIPFEGNSFSLGKDINVDPVSAAMNGGDDFKLLFTVPILELEKVRREFQTFDIIGHLAQSEVGTVLVTPEGVELTVSAQGWNNNQ